MNAPHRALATFTNAQFERLVRSGGFGDMRVELRRGMIGKMSPQFYQHAHVKAELMLALGAAIEKAGLGWRVFSEASVAFGVGFEPMPDIVVFDPGSIPANLDGPIPAGAVKLIVEVADSSLGDDLGDKLEDYAAGGLTEYWVADVQGRIILRHTGPQTGGYAKREPAYFGETIAALTHAALRVDTSALK
ncbi:MAG: Uma2 family endonuclease [Vitreimonas sp.]